MATATSHPKKAAEFIKNLDRAHWHDRALWFVRAKRDVAAGTVPEWEELRQRASEIKQYTMTHLGELLEQFEARAIERGIQIHWAKDAAEHNQTVLELLQQHQVKKLVKSKSM